MQAAIRSCGRHQYTTPGNRRLYTTTTKTRCSTNCPTGSFRRGVHTTTTTTANSARSTIWTSRIPKSFPAFSKFSNSSRVSLRVLGLGGLGGLGVTTLAITAPIAASPTTTSSSPADGTTLESRLLAASEEEKNDITDLSAFQKLRVWLMEHLWEPIATSVRFVTLLVIFAPVILTAPVILLRESKAGQSWWYAFLVQSLERAGPTFIKLGQWAASRTDIFPTELCELMSKLHSNAKAHSLHQTKKIISKAFGGRDFDEIFEEFDPVPLGVGAIAQVYKAKLAPGLLPPAEIEEQSFRKRVGGLVKSSPQDVPSSYVAIKVIHPKVDKIVNRDLRIMRFFAVLLNAVPTLEWLSFPDEVDTFSDMMRLQMDLRIEAENLGRFRANFADRTTVTFPTPYNNYTTRDVLLEEFAHGIPLEAFLESGGGPFQEEMANMGLDSFLHMLVIDNFIHSDLHPGNIMIRFLKPSPSTPGIPFFSNPAEKLDPEDVTTLVRARLLPHRRDPARWISELTALDREGFRPQLVFIDAGLVTELSPLNRRNFLDLFRAIAEFNGYHAGELMVSRSRSPDGVLFPEQFAQKMQSLVLNVKSKTLALGNISFGDILSEVLQMVRTHHVRMEGDFVNVVISMLLLEGIGRRLDPATDLLKSALPILRAVGAGGAKSAYCGEMMEEGGVLTLLKVWVALETRQFALATVEEVERGVKYDLLSPNI